ncbi:TonB-dependent receptor, partial [Pseudomonas aeruginosa]
TDNLSFSAGIYNVFDKKFMDYDLSQVGSKPPSATSDYSNKYRRNEEGRRFWLSMKYTF